VKGRADTVQVDQFLSAWSPAKGVMTGVASTDFDLAGDGVKPEQLKGSLTALGLALLAEGRLGGPVMEAIATATRTPGLREVRFRDLRLPFRVEHGRVVTDSVRFGGGAGQWQASGAIGFDGALDYAVSATLPPSVTQALAARSALAAGALTDAQGNLLLDLRVTGTAKSPRVAWDPTAMRDRIAGRVSQALQAQQQKLEGELRQAALARQQATADSARHVAQRLGQTVQDSLRRKAGDHLRGFFGGGTKDTSATKP